MEQVAVVVVARKLGLQGCLELERRRGGLQLGVDVLVAADGRHAVELVHAVVLALLRRGGVALGVRVAVVPAHLAGECVLRADGRVENYGSVECAGGARGRGRGWASSSVAGLPALAEFEQFAAKVRWLSAARARGSVGAGWRGTDAAIHSLTYYTPKKASCR